MKVPLRWLSDLVPINIPVKDLAHQLTMAGLEAEKIEIIGEGWANVYVGLVENVARHPDADRLNLVDVVAGEHALRVVTGAPNIAQGQRVPLALAGARLIDGHSESGQLKTLKPGTIRGIRSEGMVCSEKELGISDEHEGIMVLEDDAPLGAPLAEYLGDTVIEFEITPNLVHAFSILGIAREVGALTRASVTPPPHIDLGSLPPGPDNLITIEALDLCPRYAGVVIEGIKVGPSPAWMQRRLRAAGLRPINVVVDVTNYVMLEWGQPLHAFDYDRLKGGRIVVRRARPGETLETLDHQERPLTPEMLVIADAEDAVAVAGVMGGLKSEVSDETTTILLESANFDMKSVRHTSRDLRLRSDASARFERGLDANLSGVAAARATTLLLELCPGSRVTATQDVYPNPVSPTTMTMPVARIERVLGVRYEEAEILDALDRLGLSPAIDDGSLTVVIPTFRHDLTMQDDIVEEVARIIGYETLPATLPDGPLPGVWRDPVFLMQQRLRQTLVGAGFSETVTYVSVSPDSLVAFNGGKPDAFGFLHQTHESCLIRLRNPLQSERDVMRPTLVPSLLEIVASNLKHESTVRIAEMAHVYLDGSGDELPDERNLLALAMTGARDPFGRFGSSGTIDYFDLKGIVDELMTSFRLPEATVSRANHPGLHPGRSATVSVGETAIAMLGELRPDVAAAFGLEDQRVAVAEIDLDRVLALQSADPIQVKVPHYLPVQQDFAIVVDESSPAADVEVALRAGAGPLVTNVTLFDVFTGSPVPEGKKSLAYRVTFTAPDRPLTDADLGKVRGRIERSLAQRVDGVLRA